MNELYRVEPEGGPSPGPHNFFRGAHVSVYELECKSALSSLQKHVDVKRILGVWEKAVSSTWITKPVWVHGDLSLGNILVQDDEVKAVIDFGGVCIGDPSCDLAVGYLSRTAVCRHTLKGLLRVDESTWQRARGWALWKSLLMLKSAIGHDQSKVDHINSVISEILTDH